MIIDTDVLISDLRGNKKAKKVISQNIPFQISVITYMELVQGMRNKTELQLLLKQLKSWAVKVIQIDLNISTRAMIYVEDYFLSHSMKLADALIGATSIEINEPLLTGNYKHFEFIPNLQIKKFKPD